MVSSAMKKIAFCMIFLFNNVFFQNTDDLNYSDLQLVFSREYTPKGDMKYYKIIKRMASLRRLSLKKYHYIYYSNANKKYYIFENKITDKKQRKKPIIISENEANYIMNQ